MGPRLVLGGVEEEERRGEGGVRGAREAFAGRGRGRGRLGVEEVEEEGCVVRCEAWRGEAGQEGRPFDAGPAWGEELFLCCRLCRAVRTVQGGLRGAGRYGVG